MSLRTIGAAMAAALLGGPALAGGELHIFNWQDNTNPALIERFEQAYDVKVTLADYDSNETMLAKVQEGSTGFDIVMPSDYAVKAMIDGGLLAKTEPSKMENFKNVDPRWIDVYWDPGRDYSVPWQYGMIALTVDTAVYPGDINTLAILFDPPDELKGRINVLTNAVPMMHAAERYLGLPRCGADTANLKKVSDLLIAAQTQWRSFGHDTLEKLISGKVAASQNWNGPSWRARQQKPTLAFGYPREGIEAFMDNVVVLADAPNPENARLFQNFVMAPENAALISMFTRYGNGIIGSEQFMDPQFAGSPEIKAPADAPAPEFVPPCPAEVVGHYVKIWTDLLK